MNFSTISGEKERNLRLHSIDVFRALTMLLMIFVNDLWTLKNIPAWLEHKPANVDGMGLADTVFPAFLFIVGLSVPFAILARRKQGMSSYKILQHIAERSIALILMGFFMVNLESINIDLLPINKNIWQIGMILAFFLIWNYYEAISGLRRYQVWIFKIAGILLLIYLASIYKGGASETPVWMEPQWWGILGLIGWGYLLTSLVYLIAGNRIVYIAGALLLLHVLNLQEFISFWEPGKIMLVVSASNHASVMAGVLASVIFIRMRETGKTKQFVIPIMIISAVMLIYGFAVRPIGGISKIRATPSWTAICSGMNYAVFALLFLITDVWHKNKWYALIKPAGTSTLTCYLIPYYVYALVAILGFNLSVSLRTGIIGIIKSIVFSILIIVITGLLERIKIRLKI